MYHKHSLFGYLQRQDTATLEHLFLQMVADPSKAPVPEMIPELIAIVKDRYGEKPLPCPIEEAWENYVSQHRK